MTHAERIAYCNALRLKGDYPDEAVSILCALHRDASSREARDAFAQALEMNPELRRRVKLPEGASFLYSM